MIKGVIVGDKNSIEQILELARESKLGIVIIDITNSNSFFSLIKALVNSIPCYVVIRTSYVVTANFGENPIASRVVVRDIEELSGIL